MIVSLCLTVMVLGAYWQVQHYGFVTLDDGAYVAENHHLRAGFTLKGIEWAFTATQGGNWHPLTWLSFMLDQKLYGLNAAGYHLSNLLFHLANTILLFLVLRRMTRGIWQSAFVAVLFAVHPLHVESVAWITERKDVLSTLFWMLSLWAYLFYIERPGFRRYLLILLTFSLGLTAKPMLVTLPFVFLLLDYWPLDRLRLRQGYPAFNHPQVKQPVSRDRRWAPASRLILEKTPLFLLSAMISVVTYVTQQKWKAVAPLGEFSLYNRMANVLTSYAGYMKKMFRPEGLAVFYPYSETIPAWQVTLSALLLAAVTVFVIRAARRHPYFVVGWFWYLGTLIPVIGFIRIGSQAMADRYTYVPLIGLFITIAWGVPDLLKGWRLRRIFLVVSAGATMALLIMLTWFQVRYWQNSIALFKHATEVTGGNYLAHDNLGIALMREGRFEEAGFHFHQALIISPGYASAANNLGNCLAAEGKFAEAIVQYRRALEIRPGFADVHYNLGRVMIYRGIFDEASAHLQEAIRLVPDNSDAHNNLGIALARQGKLNAAIFHFREAVRLNPYDSRANKNLNFILAAKRGKTL